MTSAPYFVEPLGRQHDRATFSCGVPALDRYLQQQAGQDIRNTVATVFVLVESATPGRIAGYYTLSAFSIEPESLPPDVTRRLPRYPRLPTILIGRLAIDGQFQGKGLGDALLRAALDRCHDLSKQLGLLAVVVDAKDDAARSFYERYDFRRFQERPYQLFLPMGTIARFQADKG